MKKRFLRGLPALAILLAIFTTVIFAAETDFGVGDTGTAKISDSTEVYLYKTADGTKYTEILPKGSTVTILEAYVNKQRHYVKAASGNTGYIMARRGSKETLTSIKITGKVDVTYAEKQLPLHIPRSRQVGNFISVRTA
ncbi:MAG: hypothetical protein PUF72_10400 [Clostridiales bacterium]|nr:hypothetical protein [Clostridiales bacterium]